MVFRRFVPAKALAAWGGWELRRKLITVPRSTVFVDRKR
jgi:hypothetical protein